MGFVKRKKWSDVQVSIVVSTGRTGTKYFSSVMNHNNKYIAKHEPFPMGNIEGIKFLLGQLNEKELKSFLLKGRKSILKELKQKNLSKYTEFNAGLIFYIGLLHEIFPNIRIAHIIRDPRGFVRSGCSRKNSDNKQRYLNDNNWIIKSSDLPEDKHYLLWNKMDMPEKFMWIWNLKNTFAYNESLKHEHIRSFKFEEIMFDKEKKKEFINFIQFNEDTNWLDEILSNESNLDKNETSDFLFPSYKDWSVDLTNKLDVHCGALMKKFNY